MSYTDGRRPITGRRFLVRIRPGGLACDIAAVYPYLQRHIWSFVPLKVNNHSTLKFDIQYPYSYYKTLRCRLSLRNRQQSRAHFLYSITHAHL